MAQRRIITFRNAQNKGKDYVSNRIENKKLTRIEDIIKEIICERQFSRGARSTCNWDKCTSVIKQGIARNENIECIIVGLPFKMPTILKCSSTEADMGEASFLLQLYEFCKVSEFLIRRFIESKWEGNVTFRVISDAIRFMDIVSTNFQVELKNQFITFTSHKGDDFHLSNKFLEDFIKVDDPLV